MKHLPIIITVFLLVAISYSQDSLSSKQFDKKIDIGNYGLHINCSGLSIEGSPTVILEAGLNQGSDTWDRVQPEVAKFARVCSYDRASVGKSDQPQQQPRTSQQIVNDLHLLLEKAGIAPPFVLVGHSFGGLNVRLYTSIFSKEVIGLVLVDSVHEEEAEKWLEIVPSKIRKQMEAEGGRKLLGGEAIDLEKSLQQMKGARWHTSVPVIVLARGRASFNPDDYPPLLRSLAPKGEELRIEMQKDLATRSSKGKLLFAERSGHFIQQDEPKIVVDSIRQVITSTGLK
jgi:pimeloyl-ACP methyl ester carboxylesterase